MSKIVFEPWIGDKYFDSDYFGVRVLVLGESHYGEKQEMRPTITTEVVRWLAQRERHSFFTKVSKVLLGAGKETWLDNKTRSDIWEHIAFYNYIQGFVGNDSRIRPTYDLWNLSREPFLEVVTKLSPAVILVLGKELGRNIPDLPKSIQVCCIQHPSTGFVYSKWNPVFKDSLELAKQDSLYKNLKI